VFDYFPGTGQGMAPQPLVGMDRDRTDNGLEQFNVMDIVAIGRGFCQIIAELEPRFPAYPDFLPGKGMNQGWMMGKPAVPDRAPGGVHMLDAEGPANRPGNHFQGTGEKHGDITPGQMNADPLPELGTAPVDNPGPDKFRRRGLDRRHRESCQVCLVFLGCHATVHHGPAQKKIQKGAELARADDPLLQEKPEKQLFRAGRTFKQCAVKIYDNK